MFSSTTASTHRTARFVTLVVGTLAALAVTAPFAHAGTARDQGCSTVKSPAAGWVVVSDEQGVPTLYPVGYAPDDLNCSASPSQTAADDPAQAFDTQACTQPSKSTQPGWVTVVDEQGVPWLYPIDQAADAYQACTRASASSSAASRTPTPSSPAADTVLQSPYPGWVFVIDEQGVPTLFPIGQLFG